MTLLTALTLLICVSAAASSWQAYLMPDGSIRVTDAECDGEVVSALTLGLNETRFIEVDSEGYFSFSSSSMYVRVDEDGMLLCEGTGRATLKIYYTTTSYLEIKITVAKAPSSIRLNREDITLKPEQSFKLSYTLSRDSAGWVSFYSANEEVVSVTPSGELFAVSPGRAEIFAETYNGKSASCSVTVPAPAPASIIAETELTGYACERFTIEARLEGGFHETLSFESLNPDICTVDQSGEVYCIKEGIALINLRASGGALLSCKLNIEPSATQIRAADSQPYVYVGGTVRLSAVTTGGSGYFTVESLDESVAVPDGEMSVKALKAGRARLKLIAPGGASCETSITVLPFPKECILSVPYTSLAVGESMRYSVASDYTVSMPFTFETDEPNVLRVGEDGRVYALSVGKAVLSATSGGRTQSVEIEVTQIAKSISFAESAISLGVGDVLSADLTYTGGSGHAFFASSDESVAIIDGEGRLTALTPGSAVISARLVSGPSTQMKVTVMPAAQNVYPEFTQAIIGAGDRLPISYTFDEGCYSLVSLQSGNEALLVPDQNSVLSFEDRTGETSILLRTGTGASASINVKVFLAPGNVTMDAESLGAGSLFTHYLSMSVGETRDLNVRFEGYTFVTYTLTCFDEDVATVDENGLVTAISSGTARIELRSYNGLTREILVEVK